MHAIRQKTSKISLQFSALVLLVCALCIAPVRGSLAYSYTYTAEIINTFTGVAEEDVTSETPSESEDKTSDTGDTIQPSEETDAGETDATAGADTQDTDTTTGSDTQDTDAVTGSANPTQESTDSEDASETSNTKTNDTNRIWRYVICIAASVAALVLIWGRGRKHGDETA